MSIHLFYPALALTVRSVNQPYLTVSLVLALFVSVYEVKNTGNVYLLVSLKTVNETFDKLRRSERFELS